jgi:hypothetical protein
MNTTAPIEPASNPKVERNARALLKALNSAEGPPLEQLSPKEARDAFVNLQASAPHDLPPADIEHKTVEQEGLAVDLTIVRPIGVKEEGPQRLMKPTRPLGGWQRMGTRSTWTGNAWPQSAVAPGVTWQRSPLSNANSKAARAQDPDPGPRL